MATAIYPGSFDPLTNGHVDIIKRGLKAFDHVILAVATNPQKKHVFTHEQRIAMAREVMGDDPRLSFDSFNGLLVDYAKKKGATVILRGLRAVSDFEFELQLANMNRKLMPELDTVFMMTNEENFYVSSRLVREVASFGGDVSAMVPPIVHTALKAHFSTSPA